MALPKIDVPIYDLEIPSTGQKIQFRPFLVKEEKILLMAQESKEDKDRTLAIRQILNNCCLTEGVDIDELAAFDIEYYFIQLRARSSGENIDLVYACETEGCKKTTPFQVDLNEIEITKSKNKSNKIKLTDDIGAVLQYPTLETINSLVSEENELETSFRMIAECIEYIYDAEEVYNKKDTEPGEMLAWVEDLSQENFIKLRDFFENMPKIKYTTKIKCSECKKTHKIEIEGLQSFFM
jgi:hypothetical protein